MHPMMTINDEDGNDTGEDGVDMFQFDEMGDINAEENALKKSIKKPFGIYFNMKLSTVKVTMKGKAKNLHHDIRFFEHIQKNWLPTMPFWTSLFLGKAN